MTIPRIPSEYFKGAEGLEEPLNHALRDIFISMASVKPRTILIAEFQTGTTVADSFPRIFSNPGFTVRGLVVSKVVNVDSPATPMTDGVTAQWQRQSDGSIALQNLTGLAASTRYRIELEAFDA